MTVVINLVLAALAVLISAYVIPGVHVDGFFAALVVAVVLALINAFIRPIVTILTLPINVLTLGLFSLVITAVLVMLASVIVPGFEVLGFVPALLFGILLSLVNWIIGVALPEK